MEASEKKWVGWNWRTDGDLMENGAFFVPSGDAFSTMYAKATSTDPKSAFLVDQLTMNAGVFGGMRYISCMVYEKYFFFDKFS